MRIFSPVMAIAVALPLAALHAGAAQGGPVWPGKTWAVETPAEVGLDAGKLKAFSGYVRGRGCVVRHGCLVYGWGDYKRRGDVASAAKPVYTYFLFKALEDGRIGSLDERVVKYEPRLARTNADLGYKDRLITWRHLAYQTSCYGLVEKSGTAFCYNDWQMALFWDLLFLKVYRARLATVDAEVLHPLLTDPLQCEDTPTFLAFGARDRPGRLGISPRDFARFGLLYLRGGAWNGRRLISKRHAALAVSSPLPNSIPRAGMKAAAMIAGQRTIGSRRIPDNQADHFGSYSWLWWTNGVDGCGKRHWPDAPPDTYGALGHGGRRVMIVMPSLDLIVSWNGSVVHTPVMENRALELLVAAVRAPRGGRSAVPPRTRISIDGSRWMLNGHVSYPGARAEGLLMNVRMVNAVFEDANRPEFDPDANTSEFIARVPEYVASGVLAFTIKDAKTGARGARAAEACVAHHASWGLMQSCFLRCEHHTSVPAVPLVGYRISVPLEGSATPAAAHHVAHAHMMRATGVAAEGREFRHRDLRIGAVEITLDEVVDPPPLHPGARVQAARQVQILGISIDRCTHTIHYMTRHDPDRKTLVATRPRSQGVRCADLRQVRDSFFGPPRQ